MLKRDVGEGDSGVADVEGSAGGLLQPATAVEKGGGRHTANDQRQNVVDSNCGLVENARAEVHLRGADNLNSVGYASAFERRDAARIVAVHRVDQD